VPEYTVTHISRYEYDELVSSCQNVAWMEPQDGPWQQVTSYAIECDPSPASRARRRDYFGNEVHYFSVEQPHSYIEFRSRSQVITEDREMTHESFSPPHEEVRDQLAGANSTDDLEVIQFCLPSRFVPVGPDYAALAGQEFTPGRPIAEASLALAKRLYQEFTYDASATTILTPLSEVLKKRRGVCQDFSHIFLAGLRSLGLACRYVSGYIETYPPPGQPRLQGADASHAWVSVYIPGQGWYDVDPTNGKARTHEYIQAAIGRDYQDISPLKGVLFGGGKHTVKVSVDVRRNAPVQ
jgi:transglutaminase-like putative cysteine protease